MTLFTSEQHDEDLKAAWQVEYLSPDTFVGPRKPRVAVTVTASLVDEQATVILSEDEFYALREALDEAYHLIRESRSN